MRLRELKRDQFTHFGTVKSSSHGWTLYVFLVDGGCLHVGNSIDQPYEFSSSDESVGFARHYFPGVDVHVSAWTVEQMTTALSGVGGPSYV